MSDTPTTVNTAASIFAEILKGLIEGVGAPTLEAAILAQTPELDAVPVIGDLYADLVDWIVGQITSDLYQRVALISAMAIIDMQTNGEASSVGTAWKNLQMALASGDKNAITTARTDMDNAYLSLGHYDGSYSP